MEILSVNAQQKLGRIASAIGRNPDSWRNWSCLHIALNDAPEDIQQESMLWTKSIVESFLRDVEGRVYFCAQSGIHVICRDVRRDMLEQMAQQIQALVYDEGGFNVASRIYDLAAEGYIYAQNVLGAQGNVFSMPVSTLCGLENFRLPHNETYDTAEKPICNYQDYIKVLLIEDDPVTRWMVRNALKYECRFAVAPTANKAFAMFNAFQPDLVFLDIGLPDKSGRDVLDWIMRNDPGACVVMFSSNNNMDNISSALEEGASGFISKPFLKENLLRYVRSQAHTA